MWAYAVYIQKQLLKGAAVWIIAGIFWGLLFLMAGIVPLLLKVPVSFFWGYTSPLNITGNFAVLITIFAAITAVIIFREPIEDGTELIIITKPIARWKLIFVKFACFFVQMMIMSLIGALILLFFLLVFGNYDPVTNPRGFPINEVGGCVMSYILGTFITIMIFGSLAIILSMRFGKVGTVIISIVISFGISIMSAIVGSIFGDLLLSPKVKWSSTNNGHELTSEKIYDINGKEYTYVYDGMSFTDSRYSQEELLEKIKTANNESGLAFINVINVGSQLTDLYSLYNYGQPKMINLFGYGIWSDSKLLYTPTNKGYAHLKFLAIPFSAEKNEWSLYTYYPNNDKENGLSVLTRRDGIDEGVTYSFSVKELLKRYTPDVKQFVSKIAPLFEASDNIADVLTEILVTDYATTYRADIVKNYGDSIKRYGRLGGNVLVLNMLFHLYNYYLEQYANFLGDASNIISDALLTQYYVSSAEFKKIVDVSMQITSYLHDKTAMAFAGEVNDDGYSIYQGWISQYSNHYGWSETNAAMSYGSEQGLYEVKLDNLNNSVQYTARPYLHPALISVSWILISSGLIALTVWIYQKRDFK